MAYPIAQSVKALFLAENRQFVNINVVPVSGAEFVLTEADIVQGSLVIDRACVSGSTLEIGSCMSNELSFSIFNENGQYDDTVFAGASLSVQIGVQDKTVEGKPVFYIPMGSFTVDKPPKARNTISLTALDGMVQFDKPVDTSVMATWWNGIALTVADLVGHICDAVEVNLATDLSPYPNASYVIPNMPVADNLTYRQLLMWCCQIMGKCGYMDWEGSLRIEFPSVSGTAEVTIDEHSRFGSDIEDFSVTTTGIVMETEEQIYVVGTEDYAFDLTGNLLCQDPQTVLSALSGSLIGITYRPFTATTIPYPFLYPMDYVEFTYKGTTYLSIITNITFAMNSSNSVASKGVSEVEASYATMNPLTAREQVLIKKTAAIAQGEMNERIQALTHYAELVANSLGFWWTPITQPDGSLKLFMHDAANLSESHNVFTMNGGVFAWTDSYDGDDTVWNSAIDYGGDAMFKFISAQGLDLSNPSNDYHTEIKPNSFSIFKQNTLVMQIWAGSEGDEEVAMAIPKLVIDDPSTPEPDGYMQIGRIRFVPHTRNGVCTGLDLVYTD